MLFEEMVKRKDFVLIAQACLDLADPSPQMETPQVREKGGWSCRHSPCGRCLERFLFPVFFSSHREDTGIT